MSRANLNQSLRLAQVSESFGLYSETFVYDTAVELSEHLGQNFQLFTFQRQNAHVFAANFVKEVDSSSPGTWDTLKAKVQSRLRLAPFQSRSWRNRRKSLEQSLRQFKPEAIHVHFGPIGVLVAPIARRLNIPMFVTFHGYDISRLLRDSRWIKAYRILNNSNTYAIGVSNYICEKIGKIGINKKRIQCIHGGIHLNKFPYDPPLARFDGKRVRLLCVGRMVEKKAPIELLKAFRLATQLNKSSNRLTLTWIGDGPLRKQVDQFIAENKLQDLVELAGAQPHSYVQSAFRNHHIYTQMACTAPDGDQEGQGITLLEAGATGLPVLTTRHNGFPDVIDDRQTGFLHDEHDFEAFGSTIAKFASNPDQWEQISRQARSRVEQKFTVENQISTMIEHFIQTMHRTKDIL